VFEKYTEDARRAVFFGRFEAAQFGSSFITGELLLLGLIHEDYPPFTKLFQLKESETAIRSWVPPAKERSDPSVDLPLSNDGKRILAYAADEAERLHHKWIGSEHLLLGMLRERGQLAKRLEGLGLSLEAARETIRIGAVERIPPRSHAHGHLTIHVTQGAGSSRQGVMPRLTFVQRYAIVLIVLAFVAGVILGLFVR
jgi:ATP-dependent Clp protease ATP-binding subunit ClpC